MMKLLESFRAVFYKVLVVKAVIFNIKVFVAHSDRALRNPPCSNDVT